MAQHVFDFTARIRPDPVSLARTTSAFQNVAKGVGGGISVNTTGATTGLHKVSGAAASTQAALRAAQAQAAALTTTLTGTVTVVNSGASSLSNFGTQAGLAARRFLAFSVAAGTMVRVVQGLKEGVRAAVEFELSMNKVAQVSTDSRTQIAELRQTISGLATSLGVSSAALAETSVTLKQAGFSIKQTRDALEALALVDLAPTFDGQKQAAEGLIAAFRQFDLSSRDFKVSLSSINAVAAEFAVESADIVTAIQKAGGAFKVSAGDMKTGSQALNEFVALFTSVRDTTRESADSIATGLRTVFTRLQRQDTVAALKDLGVNLRYTREEAGKLGQSNLENQFVGAYEAVRRLSEGLAGLRTTDPRYSQVVEQLGGYRQISRVIPLLQQFETAQKALNIAQSGQLSLQAAAEKRQETLAAKTAKLKEEYLDLFRKIVDSKGFQGVANGVLVAAGAFKTFLDAARPLLPLLTALAAIKIGSNIGGIFSGFARSFVAAPGASAVKKYASGGFVLGSGNNDTEPALLMPGEFVLNKGAVARMGVPNLRDLNEGRSRFHLKRYAKGSTDPVGGSFDDIRRKVEEQRAVVVQKEAASSAAANNYNRQASGDLDSGALEKLGKECDQLAADFQAARNELKQFTQAMYAAKGQVAPKLAVYQDDGGGGKPKVIHEFDELTGLDEANRVGQNYGQRLAKTESNTTTGVPLSPGSKEYGVSTTITGRGGQPDQKVYVGYAPGASPGTPLPAVAVQAAAVAAQASKPVGQLVLSQAGGEISTTGQAGELVPGKLSAGQVRLAALRASRKDARVDQSQVQQASFDGSIGQLIAAKDREDTSASVRENTSPAEAARSRAAQQAEAKALSGTKAQSNIAALGIDKLPQDQQVRFYELANKAVSSAQSYAASQRGRAGESAAAGGDLDDFVTEYFAKNVFPKIDETRTGGDASAFVRRGGVQAAQAFFTKQGKYTAAGVLDEGQDAAGRELAPQDAILAPGADPESEQGKVERRRRKQLAQVQGALGGKLPEGHQELVEAAKALGVSAKVAHTATGAGTDSAGNITNILAGAIKAQLGATNTTDDINALKAGGVAANNPTALQEGRPTALAGGAGRPPRIPPKAPPTGGGAPDPFEEYRKKFPEEAAYQDAVLARNDQERSRRELAKGDRFAREAARTQRAQDEQSRGIRQGYAAAPGVDGRPVGDRYPAGSAEREQETYQLQQLAAAKEKYGDDYGVPGDQLAERDRRQNAAVIGRKTARQAEQSRRSKRGSGRFTTEPAQDGATPEERRAGQRNIGVGGFDGGTLAPATVYEFLPEVIGPLVGNTTTADLAINQKAANAARGDTRENYYRSIQLKAQVRQQAVADRANNSGGERAQVGGTTSSNSLIPTTNIAVVNGREVRTPTVRPVSEIVSRQTAPTTVGDRILARQARDAEGVTDPIATKAAALARIGKGEDPQAVLESVRDNLSPAQYAQVFKAAQAQGFAKPVATIVPNKGNAVDLLGQVAVTDPYSGAAQVGPDGKPVTRNVGLIAERAARIAQERIAERGGADNLSDSTKAVVEAQALAEQELAVKRELISAQENLLKLLQPQMSAVERQTKAIEDAEKALSGQTKVVKDRNGKILGTEDAVSRATARGVQAPGSGGPVYGLQQRLGGYIDGAREFATNNAATRLNARLARFTNAPTFGYAAAGAGVAGAYAANYFDQRAGKAEDAIATESGTSSYKANKGASGAISFGLAGAAAGFAAGGPVGAAIGAVAGAGYGLYSALQDAEKDIREAKIGNALTELGTKLGAFATGLPDFATTAGIGGQLDIYDREANQRAFEKANGFFGFDAGEYAEFRSKDVRKELGPLLPQIGQGLSAQAGRVGRDNPFAREGEELDTLVRDLLGRGSNRRLLGVVAQLRGTTEGDEERNVREAVVRGQQAERVARDNRTGQNGVQSSINSFDRLTKALQASADGLSNLQQRAAALSDVFDGTITAARVSANSEALDQFGRGDNGALAPLDIVAAATGELGGQLRAAGGGVNAVRGALDRVLPNVIANRGIDGADVTTEVTRGLYRDLGYDDPQRAPQEIQRTIAAVAAQLNHAQDGGRGLGGILNEVQVDAAKFNDTLVSAMSDPIKEFGARAAKQLEENANKFIDGLTTLAQRTQQVGQLYDQRASLRGNNFRTQFQIEQDRAGRGNEGLGRATVEQLEQGFDARQRRLGGNVAFSPAGLGRELGSVRTQIEEAVGRQQSAFASSGGNSPAFQQAAQEVVRLKDRAANLQQALRNLSDVTERSAVIQEKLNRLKQEEDGRLGLAERFATADYQERARINQGFVLANQAANAGSLDGFGADQQRQIVEALRSAGGVTLTGFNGSPRADDLLRNLLGNSFGGAFRLNQWQRGERDDLQGQLGARGKTAEEALGELIKHQEDANQKFFDNLRQQQTQFFATLSALLLRNRLGDTENQIAGATARQRELQENGGRARELLGRVGVTTSDQLVALRGRGQQLTALREAIQARAAAEGSVTGARSALTAQGPEFKNVVNGRIDESAVPQFLTRNGINDPEALRRIQTRYNQIYNTTPYRGALPPGAARDNEAARAALDRALGEEELPGGLVSSAYQRQNEARAGLAGIQGINPLAVQQVLSGDPKDAEDFMNALKAFDTTNNRIETFGTRVRDVADELDRLRGEAERLRTQIAQPPAAPGTPGGVVTRANGGSIFQSRGTDTVPAMLTPGEYVINAASARANAGLLHRINTAKGAVQYRYDGGPIGPSGRPLPVDQTPPKNDREEYTPDGLQYRQDGGPIIRRPSPPTLGQVAQGYLWAQDKINKGLGWLGFANGGTVPDRGRRAMDETREAGRRIGDLFAGRKPAPRAQVFAPQSPEQQARDERARRETEELAKKLFGYKPVRPISDADYEARRNPFGHTAQNRAEEQAAYRVYRRQLDEEARASLRGRGGRRNPVADAEEQRRAAEVAGTNLARSASVQLFARASFAANSRVGRPGDEGQRNIAMRGIALQQEDIGRRLGVRQFASGGPVHGAGVGDTVPSLLTNGEFVLNQNATARAGVHNLQRFNAGGPVGHVSYLANGGAVTSGAVGGELKLSTESERAMATLGTAFSQFVQQVGGFTNAATSLSQTFNVFAGHAQALSQALSSFPRSLNGQFAHTVVVTHNGAEVFAKLTPFLEQVVTEKVNSALSRAFKDAMPDAGVSIN